MFRWRFFVRAVAYPTTPPNAQFQAPRQASLAWKRELPWFLSLIMLALVHTAAYQ